MKIRIKIKDASSLKDSVEIWKKKIRDADFDLTQRGVVSIANSLMEKKEEIGSTAKFADLRDIVREQVGKFDTPKSREILAKVDELDRMYQRDPRPGSRNDYWVWDKLLRYVYNILLKASGSPSPDVKETKAEDAAVGDVIVHVGSKAGQEGDYWISEGGFKAAADLAADDMLDADKAKAHKFASIAEAKSFCEKAGFEGCEVQDGASVKDSESEDDVKRLIALLGQAHNLIIEADDLANDLYGDGKVISELTYDIEDLEAAASNLDFEGDGDPLAEFKERYAEEDEDEDYDIDEDYDLDGDYDSDEDHDPDEE